MNIDFDKIVALARNQAREAKGTTFYVDPEEFEIQLQSGEAGHEVHRAACIVQYQNPDHEISDDDRTHYAIESTIAAACIEINNLKYWRP